jgi:hypothetical protein
MDIDIYSLDALHQLWNTNGLCRLQPNYNPEWKKLTRMEFLRCNTEVLRRKKIRFSTYITPEIK